MNGTDALGEVLAKYDREEERRDEARLRTMRNGDLLTGSLKNAVTAQTDPMNERLKRYGLRIGRCVAHRGGADGKDCRLEVPIERIAPFPRFHGQPPLLVIDIAKEGHLRATIKNQKPEVRKFDERAVLLEKNSQLDMEAVKALLAEYIGYCLREPK